MTRPRPYLTMAFLEEEGACSLAQIWFYCMYPKGTLITRGFLEKAVQREIDWVWWLARHIGPPVEYGAENPEWVYMQQLFDGLTHETRGLHHRERAIITVLWLIGADNEF